ncbi:MAG TPA: DUF1674 domain-containing protein [Vineibacter sp.]|nr:DUF1674 domain-containing protein [Vineibacter sp.]
MSTRPTPVPSSSTAIPDDAPTDVTQGAATKSPDTPATPARVKEIGGPPGPEPTRYGDWQFNGRVTDF